MLINKITTGFVVQQYDTEQGRFISQEFVAGNEVEYECDGAPLEGDIDDYLAFEMVQPNPPLSFFSAT